MYFSMFLWIFIVQNNQILSESNEELCDIRKWYLTHTAQGTFDGAISPEKRRIKNEIEDILLRGQSDPTLRFAKCIVLHTLDGNMRDTSEKHKDHSAADIVNADNTILRSNDLQGNKEYQATINHPADADSPPSMVMEASDDSEVDETEMDDTEMMEEEEEEEEDHNVQEIGTEQAPDSLSSSNTEMGDIDRLLEDIIDESNENKDTASQSDNLTQEGAKLDNAEREKENAFQQEELLGNAEMLTDNKTDDAQSDFDSLSRKDNDRHVSVKVSKTAILRKRKFKFGICRLKYSHQLDVFGIDVKDVSFKKNLSDVLTHNNSYSICSGQLVMSPNYCLIQHTLNFANRTSSVDTNESFDSLDVSQESSQQVMSEMGFKEKSGGSKEDNVGDIEKHSAEPTRLDHMKGTQNGIDTKRTDSKEKMMEYLDHNLSTDEALITGSKKQDIKNEKHSSLDLENLEMIIASKTRDYETKMQSLELVIMKLENQILIEKLNKQNHTSTMSRLETQILRLENELLKMNQSYHDLRYDNEVLKKRQRRYLELGHSSMNATQQEGKHHALITEQQAKISQLSQLLHNQSAAINEMKTRSDYLEEQNRMLYQMVMNQTALMSQIMMRVQELSEQNIKQREEAQKLKEQLKTEVKTIIEERQDQKLKELSTQMLRDIDNMVSDKKLGRSSDADMNTSPSENKNDMENSRTIKKCTYEFQKKWCFGDSMCFSNAIIYSWCSPYSSVFWTECGAIYFRNRSTENEFGPFANGVVTGEVFKEDVTESSSGDLPNVMVVSDNNHGRNDHHQYLVNSGDLNNEQVKHLKTDTTVINQPVPADKINEESNSQHREETANPYDVVVDDFKNKELEGQFKSSEEERDYVKSEAVDVDKTNSNENMSVRPLVPANDGSLSKETEKQIMRQDKDYASKSSEMEDFKPQQENVQIMDQEIDKKEEKLTEDQEGIEKFKQQKFDEKSEDKQRERIQDSDQENAMDLNRKQQEKEEVLQQVTTTTNKNQVDDGVRMQNIDTQAVHQNADVSNERQKTIRPNKIDGDSHDSSQQDNTPVKADKEKMEQKPTNTLKTGDQGNKTVQGDGNKATKPASLKKGPKAVKRIPPKYAGTSTQTDPKDCYDLYLQGKDRNQVYRIKPYGLNKKIQVFCDMKNGGWTLIMKRQDGITNFFREWSDYKKGFGGVYGEHWIGNDYLHILTNQDEYMLLVDLMDWKRQTKHALYDYFLVEDEAEGYRLHVDGYSGDAGDAMNKHNGHKFSTKDVDNDKVVKELGGSCAKRFNGAGWYYKCYQNNLNGKYYRNGEIPEKKYDGITWKPWTGPNYSLKQAEMKIRPRSAISKPQS